MRLHKPKHRTAHNVYTYVRCQHGIISFVYYLRVL